MTHLAAHAVTHAGHAGPFAQPQIPLGTLTAGRKVLPLSLVAIRNREGKDRPCVSLPKGSAVDQGRS